MYITDRTNKAEELSMHLSDKHKTFICSCSVAIPYFLSDE